MKMLDHPTNPHLVQVEGRWLYRVAGGETPPVAPAPGGPPAPDAPAPAPSPAPARAPEPEERVPYSRFSEVNDSLRETRETLAQVQSQLTERDRQGLPELERARAEATDAQRRADESERRATDAEQGRQTFERQSWIRSAAQASRFHDPEDAVARIDLSNVRTAEGATREVESLARNAGHLVAPEQQEQRTAGDLLTRVLENGDRVGQPDPDGNGRGAEQIIPTDQFNAMTVDQQVALMEQDKDMYLRSLRAAAQT